MHSESLCQKNKTKQKVGLLFGPSGIFSLSLYLEVRGRRMAASSLHGENRDMGYGG